MVAKHSVIYPEDNFINQKSECWHE